MGCVNSKTLSRKSLLKLVKKRNAGTIIKDERQEIMNMEVSGTLSTPASTGNLQNSPHEEEEICFEHSRVVLLDETGAFIPNNASYIDGFKDPQAYIATRTPETTTCNFLRMIWQHQTEVIVMLDQPKENRWYFYKPASEFVPYFEMGRNFTYITSNTAGRWQPSDKYITANSMLQNTLVPIYRPTYVDSLAVLIYDKSSRQNGSTKSLSRGVIMADEMGGLFFEHTVPDLVDILADRPTFPEKESTNGHMGLCLSIDHETVNVIVRNLKQASPEIIHFKIPEKLKHLLPEWNFNKPTKTKKRKLQKLQFKTINYLPVEMYVRPAGNTQCIFEAFAKSKQIFLDVYGQTDSRHMTSICSKKYGLRNIERISIKYPEEVLYLEKKNEYMRFAVSTAAKWQKLGTGPLQYWTCISNIDKDDSSGIGGDMICVHDYRVWLTFDNLKVDEPHC